ncbi:MAG TPA: N-acetyl-gamma-glutamyl-phosphate reductase [Puia sp.]|nr:N-acetyl-gamma-glutamyl-phosphate reductase [Puia sp.]
MKNDLHKKKPTQGSPLLADARQDRVVRAGIIGGAGYTGGELIRILLHHPYADIAFIHSKSNAGKPVHEVHTDLLGETDLVFTDELSEAADVCFLCLGHGEAKQFLQDHAARLHGTRIIDLSQDHRLHHNGERPSRNGHPFVYGLPELNKAAIMDAHHIANPGCFATGIQLGLLPLAQAGLLHEVHTTGITGSTGAGQSLTATSHFSWRTNNIQAYKTLTHQHLKEIHQSLNQLQANFPDNPATDEDEAGIHFVPWRGDFARGIFVSSQIRCEIKLDALVQLYEAFYADHPFTLLSMQAIALKQVVNTNKCVLQLEKVGSSLVVIHSAIDNLLKGASGQAVQNMNLMFGLEETAGLELKASAF